jgi:hypothetical protein
MKKERNEGGIKEPNKMDRNMVARSTKDGLKFLRSMYSRIAEVEKPKFE